MLNLAERWLDGLAESGIPPHEVASRRVEPYSLHAVPCGVGVAPTRMRGRRSSIQAQEDETPGS